MTSLEKYRLLDFEKMASFNDMVDEMKFRDIDFAVAVFWMEIASGDMFPITLEGNVTAECQHHGDTDHFPVSDKGGLRCRACLMELLREMRRYYDGCEDLTPEKDVELVRRIAHFAIRPLN